MSEVFDKDNLMNLCGLCLENSVENKGDWCPSCEESYDTAHKEWQRATTCSTCGKNSVNYGEDECFSCRLDYDNYITRAS